MLKRGRRQGMRAWWWCCVAAVTFASPLYAERVQVQVQAQAVGAAAAAPLFDEGDIRGFAFPRADEDLLESLAAFDEHLATEAWEKAFRAMPELIKASEHLLVPTSDGVYMPIRMRMREKLAKLSPDGRDAFQLFYDGKARATLADLRGDDAAASPQAIARARELFDLYFISSVGDEAADWLGDAYFERGQFGIAARTYQAILDHHASTGLDEVKLRVKRAVALHRGGYRDAFNDTRAATRQRFGDREIVIAGRPVGVADYLDSLGPVKAGSADAHDPARAAGEPAMPAKDAETAWSMQITSSKYRARLVEVSRSNYMAQWSGLNSFVPPVAMDGQRLYGNWLGVVFAVDLDTGKLVWWHGRFGDMTERLQQTTQSWETTVAQFAVTAADGAVLSVGVRPEQLGQAAPFRLTAYDAATGRQRWTSAGSQGIEGHDVLSKPRVLGGEVLIVSVPEGGSAATLTALDLASGQPRWSVPLGTPEMVMSYRGQQVPPVFNLYADGELLYVLTNNGALLVIDTVTRQLQWAVKYEPPVGTGSRVTNLAQFPGARAFAAGDIVAAHGLIYIKEARSAEVLAIDPAERKIVWRRPLDEADTLVAADGQRIYAMGRELMALDAKNPRKMLWAPSLPNSTDAYEVIDTGDTLVVFTAGGLFAYSKNNGDVKQIYRGRDTTTGGRVLVGNGLVVTVSMEAINAYPLPGGEVATADTPPGEGR